MPRSVQWRNLSGCWGMCECLILLLYLGEVNAIYIVVVVLSLIESATHISFLVFAGVVNSASFHFLMIWCWQAYKRILNKDSLFCFFDMATRPTFEPKRAMQLINMFWCPPVIHTHAWKKCVALKLFLDEMKQRPLFWNCYHWSKRRIAATVE